jgi:hypothetical protein
MHYTSLPNILKLLNSLFLDELGSLAFTSNDVESIIQITEK